LCAHSPEGDDADQHAVKPDDNYDVIPVTRACERTPLWRRSNGTGCYLRDYLFTVEPLRLGCDPASRGHLKEAAMTHWQDRMVDRPEPDYSTYATGWTISGLAILATILAVWILGI
jgi:hypothetical protein